MAFPERWDRSRFERFGPGGGGGGGGGPTRYEEDYRYTERDRPGQQYVQVQDRIDASGPRGRYEERDRYVEQDRYTPDRPRRRTDRELFGDVDPREFTNMALMPYEPPPPPRPGLIRRQSSLDTFDRRPIRYEREERRIPVYKPVPVPVPVPYEEDRYRQVNFEETRGRDYYQPTEYREVEIRREKSVQPGGRAKSVRSSKSSKAKSRRSSSSSDSTVQEHESFHESSRGPGGQRSSVHESFNESRHGDNESINESFNERRRRPGGRQESIHESFHESEHGGHESVSESITETTKEFKKGKTRMPKRLVRKEAIMDLGYPFDEEEHFYVLRIALEKEQIDEVMRISATYMSDESKTTFKFDETTSVPQIIEPREEVVRTEWINPPSVVGNHRRSHSHSGGRRSSRRESRASEQVFEKDRSTTIIRSPPPPAPPVYEERRTVVEKDEEEEVSINRSRGALVVRDREYRSDREVKDEIARLEAERRALRLERDAEGRRDLALRRDRSHDDYGVVEYEGRPSREVLEYRERSPSPSRNVTRVEKDRKGRMAFVRSKD